jgi:hypothetical protein
MHICPLYPHFALCALDPVGQSRFSINQRLAVALPYVSYVPTPYVCTRAHAHMRTREDTFGHIGHIGQIWQ